MAPSYRERLTVAELHDRASQLHDLLRECTLCPRRCTARRTEGRYGVCRSTDRIVVSSASPHFGEEPPLTGRHGSGTIFFSSCNLKCQFCQNYQISHLREGREISTAQLASLMLALENAGCHNINLVTPTHVIPQIVAALAIAADHGLSLPIVYNCGGYESVGTLSVLRDIVDIYMPDIKYSRNQSAARYSGAKDYWEVAKAAVREMNNQVGCLELDERGIAVRGVLIRHLVLPNDAAGSHEVLAFIAREISRDSYVNIMDQYRPMYNAIRDRELNRPLSPAEYERVVDDAVRLGLRRGFLTER